MTREARTGLADGIAEPSLAIASPAQIKDIATYDRSTQP